MAKRWEERRLALQLGDSGLKPDADSGSSTAAPAPSAGAPEQRESTSAIGLRTSQKAKLFAAFVSSSVLLALLCFGSFLG